MAKDFKLIWNDDGVTKTAIGTGFKIHTESAPWVIEFSGLEGKIIFTANSFDGRWMIK